MAQVPVCPECNSIDRVVRVHAACINGLSSQSSHSGGIGVTLTGNGIAPTFIGGSTGGSAQTGLSKRLSPIEVPPSEGYSWFFWSLGMFLMGFLLWRDGHAWRDNYTLGAILIALSVLVAVHAVRKHNSRKRFLSSSWYAKYTEAWNKLYYCERCDIVYDADSDHGVSPEEMNEFLLTRAGKLPTR